MQICGAEIKQSRNLDSRYHRLFFVINVLWLWILIYSESIIVNVLEINRWLIYACAIQLISQFNYYLQVKDEKPPSATRGVVAQSEKPGEADADETENVEDEEGSPATNLADLFPRTDIR